DAVARKRLREIAGRVHHAIRRDGGLKRIGRRENRCRRQNQSYRTQHRSLPYWLDYAARGRKTLVRILTEITLGSEEEYELSLVLHRNTQQPCRTYRWPSAHTRRRRDRVRSDASPGRRDAGSMRPGARRALPSAMWKSPRNRRRSSDRG